MIAEAVAVVSELANFVGLAGSFLVFRQRWKKLKQPGREDLGLFVLHLRERPPFVRHLGLGFLGFRWRGWKCLCDWSSHRGQGSVLVDWLGFPLS